MGTILSALRAYIAHHPRDWDMYTDELMYAYYCQPQTSNVAKRFELLLFRPTPPWATKAEKLEPKTANDFKYKWKKGI